MATKKVRLATCNGDQISSLPDDVLCHILSFLPTKYSVRTRVLSTRWKHLFSLVPVLDFECCSLTKSCGSCFVSCVSSVFTLYKVSHMNKFLLWFLNSEHPPEHFPVISWIYAAIYRHVQEIDISVILSAHVTVPRDLFLCKTITILKLMGRLNVVLPSSVCLPCLRTCFLKHVCLDDDSARRLVRSCPLLEHLDLNKCCVRKGVELLDISSPTLKHLSIHEPVNDYPLILNVPNLLKFEYYGSAAKDFFGLENLKSVVDAGIYYGPEWYIGDVVKLVNAICNVQNLSLSGETMEALLRSRQQLPTFNNLTSLAFSSITRNASLLLPRLLDKSPRLEFLSFNQGTEGYYQDNYFLPKHVPTCVALHLKEVEFRYTYGLDYDIKLIKYFLKHAENLKKMKIRSMEAWNEQFEATSADCQIVFEDLWNN